MSEPAIASKSYWQKNKYLIVSLSVLVVVAVVAGGLTLTNWQKNQNNSDTQIIAYESKPKTKPVDSTDIKTLAEARLKQLTSGLDLATIESEAVTYESNLAADSMTAAGSPSQAVTTPGAVSTSSQTTAIIDAEKAEELILENNIQDTLSFYNRTESVNFNYQGDIYGYDLGIDYGRPVETETWSSANYYKYIIRQDGQIKSFNLYTPEYSLVYAGGKYAIKEIYNTKQYFGGLYEGTYENPEISFLKYILSDDTNMTVLGRQNVDGKDLLVYEYKFNPLAYGYDLSYPASDFATRYYIDDVNFVLYMTEHYEADKLSYRSKTLASEEITGENTIEQIYNNRQISSVEIREVHAANWTYNPEDYLVQTFIKKYDLYYSEQIPSTYMSASDHRMWANEEYTKLYFNKDFNPSMSDEFLNSFANPTLASYYQNYVGYEIRTSSFTPHNKYESVQNAENIKVSLGDEEVDGRYFELVYDYGEGSTYRTYYVEFEVNGLWYTIMQWDMNYAPVQVVKQNPVKLTKMTPERAQEIDQMMAPSVQYPEVLPMPIEGDGSIGN